MKQVITIGPDGSMSGLQRKPGQGIDLRQFGRAEIKRASLIEWSDADQAWWINVLQSAGQGNVTFEKIRAVHGSDHCRATDVLDAAAPSGWCKAKERGDRTLLFDEYDDAVKVEIAFLDALRLLGRF